MIYIIHKTLVLIKNDLNYIKDSIFDEGVEVIKEIFDSLKNKYESFLE